MHKRTDPTPASAPIATIPGRPADAPPMICPDWCTQLPEAHALDWKFPASATDYHRGTVYLDQHEGMVELVNCVLWSEQGPQPAGICLEFSRDAGYTAAEARKIAQRLIQAAEACEATDPCRMTAVTDYDPFDDLLARHPGWKVEWTIDGGEMIYPKTRVIELSSYYDPPRTLALAHAIAHLDLHDRTVHAEGVFTAAQETEADRLAAKRLGMVTRA